MDSGWAIVKQVTFQTFKIYKQFIILIIAMLRKKNYKDQDHFNIYHTVYIPRSNGSKFTFYYKRYKPQQIQQTSLYKLLNNQHSKEQQSKSLYPLDRTLQIISFDGDLDIAINLFKKIGKIRKFITGQTKYKNKQAYYCIMIFKYEFDLVKCFRNDDYFQNIILQNSKQQTAQEEKEVYQTDLIQQYMKDQLKSIGVLQTLHKEGYNVITNKFGQFKVDYEANQKMVEQLPQIKRQKKKEAKLAKLKYKNQQVQDMQDKQ